MAPRAAYRSTLCALVQDVPPRTSAPTVAQERRYLCIGPTAWLVCALGEGIGSNAYLTLSVILLTAALRGKTQSDPRQRASGEALV